eukprot:4760560-Pleurochrysis_carterae.AAC.1
MTAPSAVGAPGAMVTKKKGRLRGSTGSKSTFAARHYGLFDVANQHIPHNEIPEGPCEYSTTVTNMLRIFNDRGKYSRRLSLNICKGLMKFDYAGCADSRHQTIHNAQLQVCSLNL